MPWWLIVILIVAGCFMLAFAMMIPMGMAIGSGFVYHRPVEKPEPKSWWRRLRDQFNGRGSPDA